MMQRCGMVAVIGAPNAGKSTLVNRLAGGKVSIVTPKEQTTRFRVRGLCMRGDAQLIFIDTPGIFDGRRAFEKGLVEEAWAGVADADALLAVVDASKGMDATSLGLMERLRERRGGKPLVLALNKVDAVRKPFLLKLAAVCGELGLFERIFMISAATGDGVEDVAAHLAPLMPEGPWLYPPDQLTDQSLRALAAEITREKLFMQLRQELPYDLTVETETWEERAELIRISQKIVVEREGQKKIVIGEGGAGLKTIGIAARLELERMLGKRVHLELFVKVDKQWKTKSLRGA
ncbi:MAG: GTPase Era [Alphaproteobacteria bacterium]|nr:GTPase Era [Alphaproteobacteria bacterium]